MKQIIRISKEDGTESVADRAAVERIVRLNHRHPEEVLEEFDKGYRIASAFAFYEIREEKQEAKAV